MATLARKLKSGTRKTATKKGRKGTKVLIGKGRKKTGVKKGIGARRK